MRRDLAGILCSQWMLREGGPSRLVWLLLPLTACTTPPPAEPACPPVPPVPVPLVPLLCRQQRPTTLGTICRLSAYRDEVMLFE